MRIQAAFVGGHRAMRGGLATLCVLTILVACACAPVTAHAKSFSIASLNIGASIDPNGDVRVTEDRKITFDGQFSWVQWQLLRKGSEGISLESIASVAGGTEKGFTQARGEATEPGTYSLVDNGDSLTIRVAIREANTTLPLRIVYRVRSAAKAYSDTTELYWQFIGDGTPVASGPVHIEITPPAPLTKAQVKAWAHGPLTGVVAIGADGRVTLDVPALPANTFVEARILYPANVLTGAASTGGPRLNTVLTEESALAEAANATRRRARLGVWLGIGLTGLLSLIGVAFAVWTFMRHGREHKPDFPGGYFREDPRPDLPPAVVGALWRFGKVADADIAATLMDLADKGVIAMRPIQIHHDGLLGIGAHDEQTFELGMNPNPPADAISATDRALLDTLFSSIGNGQTVALTDIKVYAKAHAESFASSMKAWKDACEAEADARGLFEGASASWQVWMFALAVVVAGAGIGASSIGGTIVPALIGIPSAVLIAVIAVFMLRRSRQGSELYAQYKALRDFLRDFSRLSEAPPQSVVIWNRFLVLAVVFGIAEEVIAQMRIAVPQVVGDPAFQTTYWWVYSGTYGGSPVSSLQSGLTSASQIASSAMSSSSGGGGGFSGGGGGGGGGGGFSAG